MCYPILINNWWPTTEKVSIVMSSTAPLTHRHTDTQVRLDGLKGQCCQTHGGQGLVVPCWHLNTYASALLSALCLPLWPHVHLHLHLSAWQGFDLYECVWLDTSECMCVWRAWWRGATACPNRGTSITLVRQDSEGQGGAKEDATTGRKGSDVNESSNLCCHNRSKAQLSLSSQCVCVCVRGIGPVMSDSVAPRSLSSLMACLQAARSGHFTSMWGTCVYTCLKMCVCVCVCAD